MKSKILKTKVINGKSYELLLDGATCTACAMNGPAGGCRYPGHNDTVDIGCASSGKMFYATWHEVTEHTTRSACRHTFEPKKYVDNQPVYTFATGAGGTCNLWGVPIPGEGSIRLTDACINEKFAGYIYGGVARATLKFDASDGARPKLIVPNAVRFRT